MPSAFSDVARTTRRALVGGLAVAVVVAVTLALPAASPAAGGSGFCRKYAKQHHLVRHFVDGRVTFASPAKNTTEYTICSDRTHRHFVFDGTSEGQVRFAKAVDGKCLALAVDRPGDLPALLSLDPTDVRGGELEAFGEVGLVDGNATDRVVSLQLTSTCVSVIGVSGTDATGAPVRQVVAQFAASGGGFDTVAAGPTMTDAELKAVKATPTGAGVTVSWTEGGVPRSEALTP